MSVETEPYVKANGGVDIIVIFILGGFVISLLMFGVFFIATHIFYTSLEWNKTIAWAFFMAFFAFCTTMPIALITATVAALTGYKFFGKLPLWYLLVLLPLCTIALCIQNHADGFFFSEITWRYIAEGLAPIIICYLIAYWRLSK
jgi:hypothetical protein